MRRRHGVDLLYIVGAERDELSNGEQKLFVHRGLPAKYLPSNPLLRALEPKPGQTIVDATLGLASDALVIASTGARVVGIEADPLLYSLAERGLAELAAEVPAAAAIDLCLGASEIELAKLDPVDAVYIDPMFDEPRRAAVGFELLRRRAHRSDRNQLLAAAQSVATRVVMKVGRGQTDELGETWKIEGKACDYLVFEGC
jgi:16S rRNA (guanine1516-N2)-methyltransferase